MGLEETKQLLRSHRIAPNKVLGQNFMVEPTLYPKLCTYAELNKGDVVLDAGAGFGFLTQYLSDRCKGVVAVEKDPQVAAVLREQIKGLPNVTVVEGDVLKTALQPFNKVVAIPPYYLSSHLVVWLLERRVDCAVLIVQKEFADRLVASVGSEEYGWLTVFTVQRAEAELLDSVPKEFFYPQPEVDSVMLRMNPWAVPPFVVKDEALFLRLAKWLFTQRNKKLAKALVPFVKSNFKVSKQDAETIVQRLQHKEQRVRELAPKDFGELSNALAN
jgi:16S rRNA (adenine1518-N6/adenine1519-N6)-dimethyltransferase